MAKKTKEIPYGPGNPLYDSQHPYSQDDYIKHSIWFQYFRALLSAVGNVSPTETRHQIIRDYHDILASRQKEHPYLIGWLDE